MVQFGQREVPYRNVNKHSGFYFYNPKKKLLVWQLVRRCKWILTLTSASILLKCFFFQRITVHETHPTSINDKEDKKAYWFSKMHKNEGEVNVRLTPPGTMTQTITSVMVKRALQLNLLLKFNYRLFDLDKRYFIRADSLSLFQAQLHLPDTCFI